MQTDSIRSHAQLLLAVLLTCSLAILGMAAMTAKPAHAVTVKGTATYSFPSFKTSSDTSSVKASKNKIVINGKAYKFTKSSLKVLSKDVYKLKVNSKTKYRRMISSAPPKYKAVSKKAFFKTLNKGDFPAVRLEVKRGVVKVASFSS